MNKVGKLATETQHILSIYFTADFPQKGSTQDLILSLTEAGAHLIEVGVPFSDPLADGVVIQKSSQKALENGFTVDGLFADLACLQDKKTAPLILMGYFNTVLVYGVARFLENCQRVGVDTLILPDLPFDVFEKQYKALFAQFGVSLVFLITPQTSEERVRKIDALHAPFIYAVADNSITGNTKQFSDKQVAYLQRIKEWNLQTPVLVGFGISDKATFETVCQYMQGAVIGSAYIRSLEDAQAGELKARTFAFVRGILE
jgi:tryptophan synthase alpha chain